MAEPQQPEKKGPGKLRQRLKNIGTTFLKTIGVERAAKKATGQELQYELYEGQDLLEIQPVKRLKEKNILSIMESRSNAVSKVEANWVSFEGIRKEIENVYANSMIYIDSTTSKWEYELYQSGLQRGKDEMIEILIKGKPYKYIVPPKVKVRYPIAGMKRDWIVTISPFGYNNAGDYSKKYVDLINKICDDAQESALVSAKTEAEQAAIKQRISYIKGVYTAMISDILLSYCGSEKAARPSNLNVYAQIEKNYYGFVKKAVESSLLIKGLYDKLYAKRFRRQDVLYYNNFKVIQPVLYGEGAESGVVKERLSDPKYGWVTKENELGPGLDEYGYKLEVDDDGVVMLDKHPEAKGAHRIVPSQFIRNLDLMETVNYINAFHDTYRDDLRDGRYHPFTITVMDYIQANNKSVWNLWDIKNEDEIKNQSEADVNLNTLTGIGNQIKVKIKSTDKNPAFDLRFLRKGEEGVPHWKHAGRKYYYDTPEGTMLSKNNEPHISSRGVSMYILEKITRDMRKFDQAIAVLNEIGTKGGFDYGTRPWDLWGKTMIDRPYDWRTTLDAVNKPLQPEHTAEEYKEMYDISK